MFLKVHCEMCGKFMRDVSPKQAASMTGNEYCETCERRFNDEVKELHIIRAESTKEIDAVVSEYKEMTKNIVRDGERAKHKINLIVDKKIAEAENLVTNKKKGK